MAKTEFLQIRMAPEDRARLQRVADSEHLELSTWARRVLLQAVERWEARHGHGSARKVAEPSPDHRRR